MKIIKKFIILFVWVCHILLLPFAILNINIFNKLFLPIESKLNKLYDWSSNENNRR